MKRLMALSIAVVAAGAACAQSAALYNNGGTLYIGTASSVTVNGNFTNTSGSNLQNSGTLSVKGTATNNQSMGSVYTGTLAFTGTAAQVVTGSATINTRQLLVNNSAGITLSAPVVVDSIASFVSGIVTASSAAAPLTFTASGIVSSTSAPSNSSHINGYVVKQGTGSFVFPVGDATNYEPVAVNLSANSAGLSAVYVAGNAGTATFGTVGASATPLMAYNAKEYWNLSPVGTATGAVTIYWDGYKDGGITDVAHLRVAHKTGSGWQNEGAASSSGTVSSGTVTSSAVSSWSPFTLGSILLASPLPLKLMSFSGIAATQSNQLSWHTATEDPGTSFDLERSTDGTQYSRLTTIEGKGDESAYSFQDAVNVPSAALYRLYIREPSGTSYSATVLLRRTQQQGGFQLSPVPFGNELQWTNTQNGAGAKELVVLNASGQEMTRIPAAGQATINTSGWSPGAYLVQLPDGAVIKVLKQ